MKKRIIYLAFIPILLFALVFKGCKQDEKKLSNNPEFRKYIAAYTSGIISKANAIKIILSDEIASKIPKEKRKIKDLLKFSPYVEGEINWLDHRTIEFKPTKNLPENTQFFVEFFLDEVTDVPNQFEQFNFEFKTLKQTFEVAINEIKAASAKSLKKQKIVGSIQTADIAEVKNIKKLLKVYYENKELPVEWIESPEGQEYKFIVNNIERKKKATNVKIEWDGRALGVDKKGDTEIEISPLGEFKFISAKVAHQPEQYLFLQFSDPLRESQDLDGLVNIKKLSDLRYIVEGNTVKVYPPRQLKGSYKVSLAKGVKNIAGDKLKNPSTFDMFFEELKPQVRFVGKGVILPTSEQGQLIPFEAVNLRAVDVIVTKIYKNNIRQFLQVNEFSGTYQLNRVGKSVIKKVIHLDKADIVDFGKWNRFSLDLNELFKTDPGAVYQIKLNFRKSYSLYQCGEEETENNELATTQDTWQVDENDPSYWDNYDSYYYGSGYWQNRDNPCHKAYYGRRRAVTRNIFASNIALIAKKGKNEEIRAFVTDIRTAKPVNNATVEVYSYQNQLIKSLTTNAEGIAEFPSFEEPYFVVAKKDKEAAYLKLTGGSSLSLSHFDVSGNRVDKGLKGFIYGERGVWRPGDSLYITFILSEKLEKLPKKHPVIFEFKNPANQLITRLVKMKNKTGFYTFRLKTADDAPTGNWEAIVSIGGIKFRKKIKIETIKPNRLKIKIDFNKEFLAKGEENNATLNVKWLHGAIAKNLKAKITAVLSPMKTTFPKYSDYIFDDPTKRFYSNAETIFKGKVDENGNAKISATFDAGRAAPGKMNATFVTRVFENSGDFSIDQFSVPYYPYESFVGVKLPKGDKSRGMLLTDKNHIVDIVTVDANGKPVMESHDLEVQFYKVRWKWWWDKAYENMTNYANSRYSQLVKKQNIRSQNGKAQANIRVNYPSWGRYLVRVIDKTSKHSTARTVYIDWPGWAGREQKTHGEGATVLPITSDKTKYKTGEEINLSIQSSKNGRALISIENGTKVLETYWLETKKGESNFKFKATKQMSPNIYVNVSLIQPHAQSENDLPVRLYGIIPIEIENPETKIEPILEMPDELESEEEFEVTVYEKDRREMTYTLAIVDEGLLDLTRFKTPNPWKSFYAKEALGVKTWDMYDWVIGAYGGKLERLLSIGGDGNLDKKKGKKANRFKPVVKFIGPFYLANGKKTHKIKMPRYIGSVRAMVVAGHNHAYGSAEKAVPVKKPLMVLATMPRVLSPNEKVKLPVNIFAMDKNIKKVKVNIFTNDMLKPEGAYSKEIKFEKTGEKSVEFDLKAVAGLGIATVRVEAISGSQKATYEIELDVRNPNPSVTDVISKVLEPGETWEQQFKAVGITGTNKGVLEVSSIPPLNLEKRLKYLIKYPHGCVEQTTSGAFPQLYLDRLVELSQKQKNNIKHNIKIAIQRLNAFQRYNGGMGYWPSSQNVTEWGTCYAGHFLLEAKKKGYDIPNSFLKKWRKYQRKKAVNWTDDGTRSQLIQAYRLYTLALSNHAEKGAMNRLKEVPNLSNDAGWRLAAAYLLAGKERTAKKLVKTLKIETKADYAELSYTFGSNLRDKAMILETLAGLKDKKQAFRLMTDISKELASRKWLSTQSTAYSLIAIGKYLGYNKTDKKTEYVYNLNKIGEKTKVSQAPVSQQKIIINSDNTINLKNNGKAVLYARLILEGIPEAGQEKDASNDLDISVKYMLMNRKEIDPTKIEQGTDFMAEVTVKNTGKRGNYKEMALSQIFPSGWEILNTRLFAVGSRARVDKAKYTDIRDDRVYNYFDLNSNRTKTFRVLLNAAYIGKYYLPTVSAEAMYDATINARKSGQWIEVIPIGAGK